MEETAPIFTEFDVLVCVIVLIFMLACFTSGFLKSMLSIFGWVGSGILTLYFFPYAAEMMEGTFRSKLLANVVAVIGVFISSIIIISVINHILLNGLKGFRKGPIDYSLGMLFGLILGMAVVSTIHYSIIAVTEDEPEWLKNGQTYNLTRRGADIIRDMAPEYINKGKEFIKENEVILEEKGEELKEKGIELKEKIKIRKKDSEETTDETSGDTENNDDIKSEEKWE